MKGEGEKHGGGGGCSHRKLRVAQRIAVRPSPIELLARQRVALHDEKGIKEEAHSQVFCFVITS